MSRRIVFALLAACAATAARAQTQAGSAAAAADYSAVDQFYVVADILVKGGEPTDSEWNALLATRGYQLLAQQDRGFRERMAVAFKPSRATSRDSVLRSDTDAAFYVRHLIRAYELRSDVLRTRRALEASVADSITLGVRGAARFLPGGTTERQKVPLLGFAIFAADGYALDGGVLLDVLYVKENGLTDLLAHEFHHSYLSAVDKTIRPSGLPPEDVAFAAAIRSLRNEGIADQIDKPYPLPLRGNSLDAYVRRYNDTYARTPQILRSVDSLLAVVADSPSVVRAAGMRARTLLWSNSHPNGAYVARTIVETFGVDSLMPAIYNPWAMLRTYTAAEKRRGNPPPFSVKAIAVLDAMEKRYVRP